MVEEVRVERLCRVAAPVVLSLSIWEWSSCCGQQCPHQGELDLWQRTAWTSGASSTADQLTVRHFETMDTASLSFGPSLDEL